MLEQMVAYAAIQATGSARVQWKEHTIDFTPPWRQLDLRTAIGETSGIDVRVHADAAALRTAMRAAGYDAPEAETWAKLVDSLLSQALEPALIQPTFLLDYPLELSPFASARPMTPNRRTLRGLCRRMEIANAFTELNDPTISGSALRCSSGSAPPAMMRLSP